MKRGKKRRGDLLLVYALNVLNICFHLQIHLFFLSIRLSEWQVTLRSLFWVSFLDEIPSISERRPRIVDVFVQDFLSIIACILDFR